MAFIRTKRVKKNGKLYTYHYGQKSVWQAGRVRSIHLGRAFEEEDQAAERALEMGLRAAERQAAEAEAWQREHMGETAVERNAREAKEREWTQEKFLNDTTVQKEEPATAQKDEGAPAEDASSENESTEP
jgi:hypothetical protein